MSFLRMDQPGARLKAKLRFLRYPKELTMRESRIPTLSSLFREAIKRLMIKGGGFARRSRGTHRGPLKSGSTSTQRDTSFQVVSDFRAASGHFNNLPPFICVTFGQEGFL